MVVKEKEWGVCEASSELPFQVGNNNIALVSLGLNLEAPTSKLHVPGSRFDAARCERSKSSELRSRACWE